MNPLAKCPCHSGKAYSACCEKYHLALEFPTTAEQLMRSRYSAYALGLADYIIATTHPTNPHYEKNHKKWRESILQFSSTTNFINLQIVESTPNSVTFIATLTQNGQDASFQEKSLFLKEKDRWTYWKAETIQKRGAAF